MEVLSLLDRCGEKGEFGCLGMKSERSAELCLGWAKIGALEMIQEGSSMLVCYGAI